MNRRPIKYIYMKTTFCVLLSICFFCACQNRNTVKVVDTNFESEIEQQQNLVFQFNKKLFPDSLLNSWDSTDYIEFEPKVNGAFRWNHGDEIMFSPSKGFLPGMTYTAKLSKKLLRSEERRVG